MFELTNLEDLPKTELLKIYYELFQSQPPPKSRRDFILGNLSWALQSNQSDKPFAKAREQLIRQIENKSISYKTKYMEGTRIIREWKGVTHEVIVEQSGFKWKGQNYKSLSHIAREITGARWSGPRFFGLKTDYEA